MLKNSALLIIKFHNNVNDCILISEVPKNLEGYWHILESAVSSSRSILRR